ncbi:MAG TPA: alpha/beta hydrolase [Burkholderiales bacterium]|nr:alpha/beta hydrolase [Burkholderiales bacterium]
MPFAPIPGGELYFETSGSGPPLLLVSGLNGSARFWSRQVPRLAERFTVIVHDHRGVDRSSRDAIVYSIEQMAGDTLALMDHLDIRSAAMVGQSTGGAIGQHLAATQPNRISRLVLCSTWTHADAYFTRLFELRRDLLRSAGLEMYTRDGSLLLYPPEWLREHDREVTEAEAGSLASASSPEIMISRIEALLRFDGRARAPRIRCPTLVIAALDDRVTPAYFSRALAQAIPKAQLVLLEGGGHFLPIVEAERYGETVLRFLSERGKHTAS